MKALPAENAGCPLCVEKSARIRQLENRMRQQFMLDVMNQHPLQGNSFEALNQEYCLALHPPAVNFLVLRLVLKEEASLETEPVALEAIRTLMAEYLTPAFHDCEILTAAPLLVCMFNITTHRDSLETEAFKMIISQFFAEACSLDIVSGYHIIMGEGAPAEKAEDIPACYQSALKASEYGVIYGFERKYYSADVNIAAGNMFSVMTPARKTALRHSVETLQYEQMDHWVTRIFACCADLFKQYPAMLYRLPRAVLEFCASVLNDLMPNMEDQADRLREVDRRMRKCLTVKDLQSMLCRELRSMVQSYGDFMASKDCLPIFIAKGYIHQHYKEKILVRDVAKQVGLNYQYFSVLFKKEVRVTFSQYLTETRLEAARSLLRGSALSVQEIAWAVGFEDPKYFSRIFHRMTGVHPTGYRKTVGKPKPDAAM